MTPAPDIDALRDAYEKVKLWPENRMPGVNITELGEGFIDLLHLRNAVPAALDALTALQADLKAAREAVNAGKPLANAAFNISQRGFIEARDLAPLKTAYEDFDRAVRALTTHRGSE